MEYCCLRGGAAYEFLSVQCEGFSFLPSSAFFLRDFQTLRLERWRKKKILESNLLTQALRATAHHCFFMFFFLSAGFAIYDIGDVRRQICGVLHSPSMPSTPSFGRCNIAVHYRRALAIRTS